MFSGGDGGSGSALTSPTSARDATAAPPQLAGFIPRFCHALFARIAEAAAATSTSMHTVEASYFQIYNERVSDLLALDGEAGAGGAAVGAGRGTLDDSFDGDGGGGRGGGHLRVREDPLTGPFVDGLTWHAVGGYGGVERLLRDGQMMRAVAATNMNATSSRSHAVFTLRYKCTRMDTVTGMVSDLTSKTVLVDLAGSERASRTGAEGVRLREAGSINKSLSALGRVIEILAKRAGAADGGGKRGAATPAGGEVVPYRDSVLTWCVQPRHLSVVTRRFAADAQGALSSPRPRRLLKDTLGGNAKTAMVSGWMRRCDGQRVAVTAFTPLV